uniref:Uncharacterized protein n=1 Tax=Vespula pensylvanica TaxID=30213 RepID=A0A834NJ89_VESPE|nr:hypothetical protein H0235_013642 [Vespula pensylvanica]
MLITENPSGATPPTAITIEQHQFSISLFTITKEIEVEVDRKDLQLLHESGRIAKVSGLAKREDGKYLYKKYGVSEASAATIGKDRKARLVMPMLLVVVKQQEEVYLARSSREWYHRPATEEEVACADRTAELNEDRRLETVRDGEEPERVVEGVRGKRNEEKERRREYVGEGKAELIEEPRRHPTRQPELDAFHVALVQDALLPFRVPSSSHY